MWYDGQFSHGNSSGFCYYPKSYAVGPSKSEMFLCSSNEFQVGNYRLEHRGIPDFEGQLCMIWVIGNDLNYSRGKTNW